MIPALSEIWRSSLDAADPRLLFGPARADALLCWGKAAGACFRAADFRGPALVISPETRPKTLAPEVRWVQAEHPIPGPGSLLAGRTLLDFFDELGRFGARTLEIRLTGGASSLAWLPPADLPEDLLRTRLEALYRKPFSIEELNRERSSLCVLKAGGSARWLKQLAPRVRARVRLVSDVGVSGPEVVGSGPFYSKASRRDHNPRIPHEVLFDNQAWIQDLARRCKRAGLPVIESRFAVIQPWTEWVESLRESAEVALARGMEGVILWGGEPRVALPARSGRGGRMTQIAAALGWALRAPLLAGRVEILCGASDGSDGHSGGAGAYLTERSARAWLAKRTARLTARELGRFDTAGSLLANGGLLERSRAYSTAARTLTNVQDVVMIRVGSKR